MPCKSLTHCATHFCALARPSQVAGGVPVPTMRAKKHFPLFRPKSSKGYHAPSTAPSLQLPKYYQSISRALQECLLESSLDLRPPGQSRRIAVEPTRDEEPRNPLLSMRCVVKGKEIKKKMRKAAACHDPPFLCERIMPLLPEKQAKRAET